VLLLLNLLPFGSEQQYFLQATRKLINHYFKISWFKNFLFCLEYFSSQSIHFYYFSSTVAYLLEQERISLLMIRRYVIVKDRTMKLGRFLMKLFAMKTPFRDSSWSERSGASMKQVVWRIIRTTNIGDLWRKTIGCCTIICQKSPPHTHKVNQQHISRMAVQRILKNQVSSI